MRTLLLISPYFAPQAALGAYRWVKLARHLPARGWRPVVLSATFPGDARDDSLLPALPDEVEIAEDYLDPRVLAARARLAALASGLRAAPFGRRDAAPGHAPPEGPIKGLRPARSLADRCAPHAPHAARAAVRLARRAGAAAVVVSAGPFSACPVGFHVQRALGLPLVLDFRDPWGLHETLGGPPKDLAERVGRALVAAVERRWMENANYLILNTKRALDAYRSRYACLEGKSAFVRNHYDMDLYASAEAVAPPSRFVIVHFGTLRDETRVDDIAGALRRLVDRERLSPGEIVLLQVGRVTAFERRRFEEAGVRAFVELSPAVTQREALAVLRGAHVLLSMVSARVTLRIAAKTYDYVAAGMPVVSVTANPEVDELLSHRADNARVAPGDVEGLAAALGRHLSRFRATGALPAPAPPPAALSSAAAADRVAAILDRVAGGG